MAGSPPRRELSFELDETLHDFVSKLSGLYVEMGLVDRPEDFYFDMFRGGLVAYTKFMLTRNQSIEDWETWGTVLDSIVHGYDDLIQATRDFLLEIESEEEETRNMFG